MVKYITEILDEVNNDTSKLSLYKDNYAVKTLLEYSFDPNMKMALPEGEPPFKKDNAPLGMSQANFYQQVKKLYIFRRTDISNLRREQLFVQMLESLHPTEAEVCIAIKDQTLHKKYPNISRKVVEDFGFVKKLDNTESVVQETPTKSGGRNLVINFSDTTTTKDNFGQKPPVQETLQEAIKRPRGRPKKIQ